MDKGVEERIAEFERALDKYLHFLRGGRIDRDLALRIERIQLEIIEYLSSILPDPPMEAWEALGILRERGLLADVVERVSKATGDEPRDIDEALAAFQSGDLDKPGAKTLLIAVQAVARYVADKRLEKEGPLDIQTPHCPVCGAESKTMIVGNDGFYMICPFCAYKWRISRSKVVCPYCGSDNPISIGVFTDRRRRIGLFVCQECGATWRGILDRSIRAPRILLPLISLGAESFRRFAKDSIELIRDGEANASLEGGQ